MGSLIGGVVALLVGGLLAVGVSTAIVSTQHPDSKTESNSSQLDPNETSDDTVLDYGVH